MKYLIFLCLSFQVFAKYPHVDLGQGFYRDEASRQLSSVETQCESDKAIECMQFDHQVGPNVVRFSLLSSHSTPTQYFDFKLQKDCFGAEEVIESAQNVSVKNVRLSQGFSGEADIYVDGVNLILKCESPRLPSSN